MGNPSRQLAKGSKFLRPDQLALGIKELHVGLLQLLGPFKNAVLQVPVGLLQMWVIR